MRGEDITDIRQRRGQRARRDGHRSEWLAALLLMAKGYQILAFRLRTPQAEIDLLARRGRTLAVIEVKRRKDITLAQLAVTADQRQRLLLAGNRLIRSRPSLARLQVRLDLVAIAPGRFPRHIQGLTADVWDQ